jgi:hypothetical protein
VIHIPCSLGLAPTKEIDILRTVAIHDFKGRKGSKVNGWSKNGSADPNKLEKTRERLLQHDQITFILSSA